MRHAIRFGLALMLAGGATIASATSIGTVSATPAEVRLLRATPATGDGQVAEVHFNELIPALPFEAPPVGEDADEAAAASAQDDAAVDAAEDALALPPT